MYGDVKPFEIYPIGIVRSKIKTPQDRGRVATAKDEALIVGLHSSTVVAAQPDS